VAEICRPTDWTIEKLVEWVVQDPELLPSQVLLWMLQWAEKHPEKRPSPAPWWWPNQPEIASADAREPTSPHEVVTVAALTDMFSGEIDVC
jgi:hypothetical protein